MTLTPEQKRDRLELLKAAITVERRKIELAPRGRAYASQATRYSYFGKRAVKLR